MIKTKLMYEMKSAAKYSVNQVINSKLCYDLAKC